MFDITENAIIDAIGANMDWVKEQFFFNLAHSTCPLLNNPGFLLYTLDTNENLRAYFLDKPTKPKSFMGDEPIDDEDEETVVNNNIAKFECIEVFNKQQLMRGIEKYYANKFSQQIILSGILNNEYSSYESFKEAVFSECLGFATVGLTCEKFSFPGCIDSRNTGSYNCPFV